MKRREFFTVLGGMAAYPLAVRAQTAKVPRVAVLWSISPVPPWKDGPVVTRIPVLTDFLEGMRALGYVEGKNFILELRSAEGKYERFPEILRSLISLNVDVIVTTTSAATKAAKDSTQTIPIVMVGVTNPVGQGFVQSLAQPGGNITGNTDDTGPENAQKRLQLLKELLPTMTTVAHLGAGGPRQHGEVESLKAAAGVLGVKLLFAEHPPTDYTSAFALIARERPDAMFVSQVGSEFSYKNLIFEFAASNRLPTIYHLRDFVTSGGLMSLGVGWADLYRLAAVQIDKILKGAKPSDLPVEQLTKFELVVNLKTAKALGLTIPPSILIRADEVIE